MSLELPGIFAAGLLTFLSPCILPLVPLYLALLGGTSLAELQAGGRLRRLKLVATAVSFALGLSVVFVGLGLAATSVGHALVSHRLLFLQLGGLVVFLFGLRFIGVLRVPFLEREARPWFEKLRTGGGVFGAFAFGAAFALGWTPCIGPVLGSVLTFTASTNASAGQGALYLGTYALGLSLPLIAAAAVAPSAIRVLGKLRAHTHRFEVAMGVVLMALGVLLITDNLERIAPSLSPAPIAATAPESDKAVAAVIDSALPRAAHAAPEQPSALACTGESGSGGPANCGLPAVAAQPGDSAQATAPSGRVLVEFVSPSCPVCQRMAPVVAAAEHDCRGRDVHVQRVDVSEASGSALAHQFNVRGVPTFVFLDQQHEVARLVGEQPLSSITQSLEVLAGEKCDGFRALP